MGSVQVADKGTLMSSAATGLTGRFSLPRLGTLVARSGWGLLTIWLVAVYLLVSYALPQLQMANTNIYVLQPLLWGSVGALSIWLLRREFPGMSVPRDRWVVGISAVLGLFSISLLVLFGILAGFGHTPFAQSPLWMAANVWFILTRLAGVELARWYLLLTIGRRRPMLGMPLTFLLLTVVTMPSTAYDKVTQTATAFPFLGEVLLPNAGENGLATYLSMMGGPVAAFGYRGVLVMFTWLSPILPDLPWATAAFVGILAPILGLSIAQNLLEKPEEAEVDADGVAIAAAGEDAQPMSPLWIVAFSFVIFMFWFNTGLFGIRPAITTGVSMEPMMQTGDLVVVRDVSASEVEVGDVIRWRGSGGYVLHRVIEIREEGGQRVFITQGDNIDKPDEPVTIGQFEGKMVAHIPKVGWLGVWAKDLINVGR